MAAADARTNYPSPRVHLGAPASAARTPQRASALPAPARASALPTPARRTSRGPTTTGGAGGGAAAGAAAAQNRRGSLGFGGARAGATGSCAITNPSKTPVGHLQQQQHRQNIKNHEPVDAENEPENNHVVPLDRYADAPAPRTPARSSGYGVGSAPATAAAARGQQQLHAPPSPGRAATASTTTPVRNGLAAPSARGLTTPVRTTPAAPGRYSGGVPGRRLSAPGSRVNPNAGPRTTAAGAAASATATTTPSHARNAGTPDRSDASASRAIQGRPSTANATRQGLVASPYQRRTSYGNGPSPAPGGVARRLNLTPAVSDSVPVCTTVAPHNTSTGSTGQGVRSGSAANAPGSPYVRRTTAGGSRIAIDRADKTFQPQTQQSTNKRMSALESFRNARRASDPRNFSPTVGAESSHYGPVTSIAKDGPPFALDATTFASEPRRAADPGQYTNAGRDGMQDIYVAPTTLRAGDSVLHAMPDRHEETFGVSGTAASAIGHCSFAGSPVPSSTLAKRKRSSDRFTEGTVNIERVERMSRVMSRRRSRGQSGGPSDFPEDTPTPTVAVRSINCTYNAAS